MPPCQQNHRTRKGASPSLELVKISVVVGAAGLVKAGRDEWGGLVVGGVEAAGSQPRQPLSLNPLSGLSKPSHHTQLFTVKHTDHYEQARDRE